MVALRVSVHDRARCADHACCVHNPSDHHMYGWRQHWRVDRARMERLCAHGFGHPDPDHVDHVRRTCGDDEAWFGSLHDCDGCCVPHDDRDDVD